MQAFPSAQHFWSCSVRRSEATERFTKDFSASAGIKLPATVEYFWAPVPYSCIAQRAAPGAAKVVTISWNG